MVEEGKTIEGIKAHSTALLTGKQRKTYISKTDRLLLHFCYNSHTFASRNIRLRYSAKSSVAPPIDIGPPSVYVIGFVVIIFIIAIFVIKWAKCLRPCLDPIPAKKKQVLRI